MLSAFSPGVSHAASPETYAVTDRSGGERFPAKPTRPAPSKKIIDDDGGPLRDAFVVPQTVLTPLKLETLLAQDAQAGRTSQDKIVRAGVGRPVHVESEAGNWYDAPAGRLWLAEIVSPGAFGLRVQFANLALPKGAELAVTLPGFGEDPEKIEWVEADPRLRGETYAPIIPGDRVRIEYFVPNGSFSQQEYVLPFKVAGVQHFYRNPLDGEAYNPAAGACHNDVTCHPAWASAAKSVARATFVKNGSSYLCSGQLINSQSADLTPYFLTANHCVPTQAVASTLQFFWGYQTASCGGLLPALQTFKSSAGASLMAGGAGSDFSLLMIEGGLPSGLTWVGWTSAPVPNGTASSSIHHPAGDYKRISFGNKAPGTTCGGENHLRVDWTDGPTEGGSSGAGIFRNDTQQLYGQLHCGNSKCGSEASQGSDDYGSFAATYPKIAALLAGGSDDTRDGNDSCAASRALSPGRYDQLVVKSLDPDWYAVTVPAGKTLTVDLAFSHLGGDVDAAMYTACGGNVVAVATGSGNQERMTVTNSRGAAKTYLVNVFLYADTRNSYSMNLLVH